MPEHECIIGLFHDSDSSDLITLNELKSKIKWNKEFNACINNDPIYARVTWALRPDWTLKDYADKRKSTNLHHFDFCPICSKAIDWKAIKKLDENI
jgi:hypothetical protein